MNNDKTAYDNCDWIEEDRWNEAWSSRRRDKYKIENGQGMFRGFPVHPIFDSIRHMMFTFRITVRFNADYLTNPHSSYEQKRFSLLKKVHNAVRKELGLACRKLMFCSVTEYGMTGKAHANILYWFRDRPDLQMRQQFAKSLRDNFRKEGVTDVHIDLISDFLGETAYCCKVEKTPYEHHFHLSQGFEKIVKKRKSEALKMEAELKAACQLRRDQMSEEHKARVDEQAQEFFKEWMDRSRIKKVIPALS